MPENLEEVKKILDKKNLTTDYAGTELVAQTTIAVDEKVSASLNSLVEDLDANDDVNNIYTNEA